MFAILNLGVITATVFARLLARAVCARVEARHCGRRRWCASTRRRMRRNLGSVSANQRPGRVRSQLEDALCVAEKTFRKLNLPHLLQVVAEGKQYMNERNRGSSETCCRQKFIYTPIDVISKRPSTFTNRCRVGHSEDMSTTQELFHTA